MKTAPGTLRPDLERPYDVIVIGGGPAGACAATLVAAAGRRTLVVERDRFPRFKIGESLMPASHDVFARLGVLEKLGASTFPRKHSVQFYGASGRASAPFYFSETNPGESAVTWQVLRSEFDQMLLDNARTNGADVIFETRVRDIVTDGERVTGVSAEVDGRAVELSAKVVVDASGQSALVARKLGIKKADPKLKQTAIFTHYDGAVRDSGIDEGATLIFHTASRRSWFWFIPMPEGRASVGVVGRAAELFADGRSPEEIFADELARCPALAARLENATRAFAMHVMKDFSYRASQIAGDGWVLVGDALGFLDPIYSSGLLLALRSGEFAADAINDAFAAGDLSGARLGAFADRYLDGLAALHKLVYAFYSPDFSFARFLQTYPQHRHAIVDLLTGDVFDRDHAPLFDDMATMCELPGVEAIAATQPR